MTTSSLILDDHQLTIRPGGWVHDAQAALDELSTMRRLEEVEAHFGSARRLVEVILGHPIAGGHATRATIRKVGLLLGHRLGPAVAAEALSWTASAAEVVDTTSIEHLLESAAAASATCRPLRLDDRYLLHEHLAAVRAPAARRRLLLSCWDSRPHEVDFPRSDADTPWWLTEDPVGRAGERWGRLERPTRTIAGQILSSSSPEEQAALFEGAAPSDCWTIIRSRLLFELHESIVARLLYDRPGDVLANPACPTALRERIRYPYDDGTLELAIRAGRRHYEQARVRRLLAGASPDRRAQLLAEHQIPYLTARRDCGLITAHDLVEGELAGVDLSDRALAEAALGTGDDWRWRRMPAVVVEVLLHHPQAADLTWIISKTPRTYTPDGALRSLADHTAPPVRATALRLLDPTELLERDEDGARHLGAYWVARCPGIPAEDRPPRPAVAADARDELYTDGCYAYPPAIEALAGTYAEAPGWTITLPRSGAELRRNAKLMRNCTSAFDSAIVAGEAYLLIVHAPSGERYNASIHRSTPTSRWYQVGQINSWANGGYKPDWLRPALRARLCRPVPAPEPAPRSRPRHDRSDRRRAQASAAHRQRR